MQASVALEAIAFRPARRLPQPVPGERSGDLHCRAAAAIGSGARTAIYV